MAGAPRILFGCLLYLLVVSSMIAYFATGMGIAGISGITINPTDTNPITIGYTFAVNLMTVIAWTLPESVFPLILNLIFIKTALVGVIVGFLSVVIP